MADDLLRASGLWLKDGKRGKYMTGEVEDAIPAGARVLVFKNDRKASGSNSPDYTLFYILPEDQPPMRRAEPTRQPERATAPPDEDIPF